MLEQKRERQLLIRKFVISILLVLIGVGGYFADTWYLHPMYQEQKAALENNASFVRKINSVNAERKNYAQMLTDTGKEFGNINGELEEYIAYLGHIAVQNRLNVGKITVGELRNAGNSMYALNMKIELDGEMYNIKNMMQELSDSTKVSQVNAFSYRQIQTDAGGSLLSWLTRSFDGDVLIKWWSGIASSVKSTNTSSGTSGQDEEPEIIAPTTVVTADDLMQQNPVKYYLDIDFIGVGG